MIKVMTDAALAEENARLKARLAETEAALADAVEAQRRLEAIISELHRERFGARSEKLDPEQFNLPLEDVEMARGILDAAQEKAQRALKGDSIVPRPSARRNRGHLPKHLPRIERVIEPASTLCPCGCGEMARIGEDVSERLDIVPAQLRVLVTRRPRYACRRCSGVVVQAHAPEHIVPGGLPTEALIAQVIVSKFGENWALLTSLVETCKLNSVDPQAWLTVTFHAIIADHKQSCINDLLPWNYAPDV